MAVNLLWWGGGLRFRSWSMSGPMNLARKRDGLGCRRARLASMFGPAEAADGHDHDDRWYGHLLQGLGVGPTGRLQPWLAAFGRRLGYPDAVLPPARLPRHRP